jgi:DNA-binding NtrC family response regulator
MAWPGLNAHSLPVISTGSDASLTQVLEETVRSVGHLHLVTVTGVDEAICRAGQERVGLVLIHQVEGEDASEAARLIRGLSAGGRKAAVIVLSDRHRAGEALMLLRLGAVEYLSRPLDLNRIAYLIDSLTLESRYAAPRTAVVPVEDAGLVRHTIDGENFLYMATTGMGRLMKQINRVASRDATILLGGETGTGKTQLARLIHDLSGRRGEPFHVVNCGALSAALIESEMFGHVRGAFTGADRDHTGKFQVVGRGTLLLDEVDSLPPALQAKLLRVVENRLFEPVGSNRTVPMRARLIAASNRSLDQEVAAGRFRADLFYRLNVVHFELPPLRQRDEIVLPLAEEFAAESAGRCGRPAPAIDARAARALKGYSWPGNIRELRNVIERAVALCDGDRIEFDDLPDPVRATERARPPVRVVDESPAPEAEGTLSEFKEVVELTRIRDALRKHDNNRLRAAAELGISRMTLYTKLHKYGLMSG